MGQGQVSAMLSRALILEQPLAKPLELIRTLLAGQKRSVSAEMLWPTESHAENVTAP